MNVEVRVILAMLRSMIAKQREMEYENQTIDWSKVYGIAYRNRIIPFLLDEISQIAKVQSVDVMILENWKEVTLQCSLLEYKKKYMLQKILAEAAKQKVFFIVFKGPVLANVYPNYALRLSSDTDILIQESEKDTIFAMLESLGYRPVLESEENVYSFSNATYSHNIELHTTLYGEHKGPKIDLLLEMDLTKEETLQEIKACGLTITTLGFTEQLIYLMFHMIKHFTLEGITIRYLVDIVLYINAYMEEIHWNVFWDAMKKLAYEQCCVTFFSVGVKYLGLDRSVLQHRSMKADSIIDLLVNDIIHEGVDSPRQTFQIWGMMQPYLVGNRKERHSKLSYYAHFFSANEKEYAYAKKMPILLPVCWFHRLGKYIMTGNWKSKNIYSPRKKVNMAETRLEILEKVGLLEKEDSL